MTEVGAEEGHGYEVEDDDEGILKGKDDHFPRAFSSEFSEFSVCADGEVEDVEDDEGEDGEATPNHEA